MIENQVFPAADRNGPLYASAIKKGQRYKGIKVTQKCKKLKKDFFLIKENKSTHDTEDKGEEKKVKQVSLPVGSERSQERL